MAEKPDDLQVVEELFAFLQGTVPDGHIIEADHVPKLTDDQAWTVIWYLGNLYRQVSDHISRCDVCGCLYDTEREGECLDYGAEPYHFCENCVYTDEYETKKKAEVTR